MSDVQHHHPEPIEGILLTPSAERHILTYLVQNHKKGVRFSVKKTGCSGLSYVVDYVDEPTPNDQLFPLCTETIICIDKLSYPYLKGMKVDYVKQGLNHKFVFQNPNQTGQCGCGESFTVDKD
jgi:iron-sulfur cluster assembly protein